MKNILLKVTFCAVALCSINFVGATRPTQEQRANHAYNMIMNEPWDRNFNGDLRAQWPYWSAEQRQAMIRRLDEQGLLSPAAFYTWKTDKAPTIVE